MINVEDVPVAPAPSVADALPAWPMRHVVLAVGAGLLISLLIGFPTDVIPNPVFGRPVPVTWWSYPTLLTTAVLGGLLAATTYVGARSGESASLDEVDAPTRRGGIAGLLTFFAVGCPVCNKLVIVALGTPPEHANGSSRSSRCWAWRRSCCRVGRCAPACTRPSSARSDACSSTASAERVP